MQKAHLGLFILVFSFVFSSYAEEEKNNPYVLLPKDVYFQPGGGIRVRYENLRQATGEGFPGNEDESQASHRAQFDFKLYKGEYFETFFRFINHADWGSASADTSGGQHDGFSRTNGILVNQAFGTWKVDETIGLRFGRAPLHLGLGYTYGTNDWFNVPYSFDMIDVGWDWGGIELAVIAAKIQEFSTVPGQTVSSDPEENHIILNLNLRNALDALEFLTFNFVQVNRDVGSPDGGASVVNGLNSQRLSLESKISGKNFFGTAFFAYVAGEEKVAAANQVNSIDKLNVSQTAFDIKLGYNFTEANNLKFWGGYHYDTGDGNPDDSESQGYDSFYYEVYGQSGLMDMIRWGNLSFFRAGLSVDLYTGLTIGADWFSMSRTEPNGAVHFGDAGRFYNSNVLAGDLVLGSDKDLGNEFDMWLERKYQSGVNVRVTFSNFFPGATFSKATGPGSAPLASGNTPDSDIFQFLAQVGYFF